MSKQTEFINQMVTGAVKSMNNYGVLASITIAQAILESGWGRSTLATRYKNLFGIKADIRWKGKICTMRTAEYTRNNEKYYVEANFRKYDTFEESIEDHALFLVNNRRYREHGFFSEKDYKGQAAALLRAGYATSPEYAKMLIQLIKQYKLYQYDKPIHYTNVSNNEKHGTVTASVLNVRSGPGTNNKIIGQLRKDTKVKISKERNGWYDIYFANHGGYVSKKYIKII